MFITLTRANTNFNPVLRVSIYKIIAYYPDGEVTSLLTDCGVVYTVTETVTEIDQLIIDADAEVVK